MSDNFKIMDSFEEFDESDNSKKRRKKRTNKTIAIVIVVVVSLLIGVLVFVGSNAIFNPSKKKETPTSIQLDLKNENVDILYHYVTYGTRNKRNDKFIKNKSVTLKDFTNEEKLYYALQFAQPEDFVFSKKYNEKEQKIYNFSKIKLDDYIKRFFGDGVVYATDDITYPFSFRINDQNVGIMKYSTSKRAYETVFDGLQEDIKSTEKIEPYYAKLVSAEQNLDNSITLKEKIIFTELEQVGETYMLTVYKDYDKTNIISRKQDITLEQLEKNPIKVDDYINICATIEYTFPVGLSNNYYFASSKIID